MRLWIKRKTQTDTLRRSFTSKTVGFLSEVHAEIIRRWLVRTAVKDLVLANGASKLLRCVSWEDQV